MIASTPPTIGGPVKCSRPTRRRRALVTARTESEVPSDSRPAGLDPVRFRPGAPRAPPLGVRAALAHHLPDLAVGEPADPDTAHRLLGQGHQRQSNKVERN